MSEPTNKAESKSSSGGTASLPPGPLVVEFSEWIWEKGEPQVLGYHIVDPKSGGEASSERDNVISGIAAAVRTHFGESRTGETEPYKYELSVGTATTQDQSAEDIGEQYYDKLSAGVSPLYNISLKDKSRNDDVVMYIRRATDKQVQAAMEAMRADTSRGSEKSVFL